MKDNQGLWPQLKAECRCVVSTWTHSIMWLGWLVLVLIIMPELSHQLNQLYETDWFEDFDLQHWVQERKDKPSSSGNDLDDSFHLNHNSENLVKAKLQFQEYLNACEQSQACQGMAGDPERQVNCVRICVSPHCYAKLYRLDPYEEGEVDLRFPAFAQCFYKSKMQATRHYQNV